MRNNPDHYKIDGKDTIKTIKGETKVDGLKQIKIVGKVARLNILKGKIEKWAIDRELDKKGTVEGQLTKTSEEAAELIIGISKGKKEVIKDSIGDTYVTLVVGNMLDRKLDFDKLNITSCKMFDEVLPELPKQKDEDNRQAFIFCMASLITSSLEHGYRKDILEIGITNLMGAATAYELDFVDCVESAYEEISDRKGKMVNGTFVKESDLIDTNK